jgi:hypothetical protein
MHLGQCGVAKSGNYLVYQIQRDLLEQLGVFRSFVREHGIWEPLIRLNDYPFSFPEQGELDHVNVRDDGVAYLFNAHLKAEIGILALDAFRDEARLVWTHQKPLAAHHDLLGRDRRWVYVIRDGRDVVDSWMHYVVSPRMRARNPQYRIDDVNEIYQDLGYFEKTARYWVEHVRAFQALGDRYFEMRFERLVADKAREVERLVDWLGLSGRVSTRRILERTGVEATRRRAPQHVRKARAGTWRDHFDARHVEIFRRVADGLLEALGFSDGRDWQDAA